MSVKEGWGYSPHISKKWHYFVNGTSLCRKIGFFHGELEQGNDDSPDNCTACKKALKRLKERKIADQRLKELNEKKTLNCEEEKH